jgi:hypothetical protein
MSQAGTTFKIRLRWPEVITQCKTLYSRLNVPIAAKQRLFLLNPRRANQRTANYVFQSIDLGNQTLFTEWMGLTLNKHGQGEDKTSQLKRG